MSTTHPAFTGRLPSAGTQGCTVYSNLEKVACLAGEADLGNKSPHHFLWKRKAAFHWGSQGNLYRRGGL